MEQIRELEYCRKNEEQQMKEFMESFVTVERYVDVEKKLGELEGKEPNVEEKEKAGDVKEEQNQSEMSEKVEENVTIVKEEEVTKTATVKEEKEIHEKH